MPSNPRIHPTLVLALVAALALGVLALRHGTPSSGMHDAERRAELNAAARSLLPGSFRELTSQDGQCVAFAAYPSCLTVIFERQGAARVPSTAEVRSAADAAGWESTGEEVARSQTTVYFRRDKLKAWVSIRDDAPSACSGPAVSDCPPLADELQVSYSE
jgi:hypothetical protein